MAEPLNVPPIPSAPTPPDVTMCATVYPNSSAQSYQYPNGTAYDPQQTPGSAEAAVPTNELILTWTSDTPQIVCPSSQ